MQTERVDVGTVAPTWTLNDNVGVSHSLPVLQAHKPTILTFLRHFG